MWLFCEMTLHPGKGACARHPDKVGVEVPFGLQVASSCCSFCCWFVCARGALALGPDELELIGLGIPTTEYLSFGLRARFEN